MLTAHMRQAGRLHLPYAGLITSRVLHKVGVWLRTQHCTGLLSWREWLSLGLGRLFLLCKWGCGRAAVGGMCRAAVVWGGAQGQRGPRCPRRLHKACMFSGVVRFSQTLNPQRSSWWDETVGRPPCRPQGQSDAKKSNGLFTFLVNPFTSGICSSFIDIHT